MKTLLVPEHLRALLNDAHTQLAISISGGKDSQAMLATLVSQASMESWKCRLFAIHADLGRVEWAESLPHCQFICKEAGIPLVVVRRAKGDLLSRWQERMKKLTGTGKPFWSSARNRYCTSELKRGPIDHQLRH
jgi:tRNA(Ile)-lysidine synthase TilS/MesJ